MNLMDTWDDPILHWKYQELADYEITRDLAARDGNLPQPPIDRDKLEAAKIVFCPPSRLIELFNFCEEESIENHFVLVGGSEDYDLDNRYFIRIPSNVHHFFARNVVDPTVGEDFITCIPIGISTHMNQYREATQKKEILDWEQRKGIFVWFNINTNHGERDKALEWVMKNNEFHYDFSLTDYTRLMNETRIPWVQYMHSMEQHKFVICPPGGGRDTYRLWEAMYLGCIPIVVEDGFVNNFYNHPMVVLRLWEELATKDFSQRIHPKFSYPLLTNYYEELTFSYWANMIKSKAEELQ